MYISIKVLQKYKPLDILLILYVCMFLCMHLCNVCSSVNLPQTGSIIGCRKKSIW